MTPEINDIRRELQQVIDPELMVNIIDLGLIYNIEIDAENHTINIDLTLTSPGCPLGDIIMNDIKNVLNSSFIYFETNVNLVWQPAWNPELMTDKGKQMLNI